MQKNKYKYLIFDFDGTIADTILDIADAVNHSLKENSLPTHTYEEFRTFVGNGSKVMIQRACNPITDEKILKDVFDCYFSFYCLNATNKTVPFDGIVSNLEYAKKKGVKLFIFSNKPQKLLDLIVEKIFPHNLFEVVVGVRDDGITKPNVSNFNLLTKNYDIKDENTAYFGDSDVDMITANNLHINNRYAVSWGYQDISRLSDSKKILDNPSQIKDVIHNVI
jgi:phosphoglycolate phosphatase